MTRKLDACRVCQVCRVIGSVTRVTLQSAGGSPHRGLFPDWECRIPARKQVVAKRTLRQFRDRHPQAELPLCALHALVERASWNGPADVKAMFGTTVDSVADHRVIFDIGGNKYRLIAHVAYRFKRVLVKFVGTHREVDAIDPETV